MITSTFPASAFEDAFSQPDFSRIMDIIHQHSDTRDMYMFHSTPLLLFILDHYERSINDDALYTILSTLLAKDPLLAADYANRIGIRFNGLPPFQYFETVLSSLANSVVDKRTFALVVCHVPVDHFAWTNRDHFTPCKTVIFAVWQYQMPVEEGLFRLRVMLECGADPNQPCNLLFYALDHQPDWEEIPDLLLQYGAVAPQGATAHQSLSVIRKRSQCAAARKTLAFILLKRKRGVVQKDVLRSYICPLIWETRLSDAWSESPSPPEKRKT